MNLIMKVMIAFRLGFVNIARVLYYRFSVCTGANPVRRLSATPPTKIFFSDASSRPDYDLLPEPDVSGLKKFGLKCDSSTESKSVPDWHCNVITGFSSDASSSWWLLPDFDQQLGDIKGVWETSRFGWVFYFAQRAAHGDASALNDLNDWLHDWCDKNPPYLGANWKCGQEASIRVMHLAIAALLLKQVNKPAPSLIALLRIHLRRIAPTIHYAIAQDNNHGTSEAAALFIGGSWLAAQGDPKGKKWHRIGRKWLENRARRLIEIDGSFSQYSVNYHRVMLDTYSMTEVWRRAMRSSAFSTALFSQLQAATAWLGNMVSPDGTDTPNLGSNDGARLLPLTDTDYRDVRPSVQLASVLFAGVRAYAKPGDYDTPLRWLKVPLPDESVTYTESRQYDHGGYVVMRRSKAMALLRYPRFRFRPGQSDLLHLDFWRGELNLLRDGGSYSYNCDEPWQSYFPGSAAHNTVQFDGRDAMPRLSRFLFGAWPKAEKVLPLKESAEDTRAGAGYRDWKGANHCRMVTLTDNVLKVTDEVHGFDESAVLRWRLAPGEWHWEGDGTNGGYLEGHGCRLRITASQPLVRCELVEGWESRYYSQKTPLPVLEVEVAKAGKLITELSF